MFYLSMWICIYQLGIDLFRRAEIRPQCAVRRWVIAGPWSPLTDHQRLDVVWLRLHRVIVLRGWSVGWPRDAVVPSLVGRWETQWWRTGVTGCRRRVGHSSSPSSSAGWLFFVSERLKGQYICQGILCDFCLRFSNAKEVPYCPWNSNGAKGDPELKMGPW